MRLPTANTLEGRHGVHSTFGVSSSRFCALRFRPCLDWPATDVRRSDLALAVSDVWRFLAIRLSWSLWRDLARGPKTTVQAARFGTRKSTPRCQCWLEDRS
ncbi:hypothetical protein NL676_004828 [Syzygium grande]|nr:hypothetical protein NL676_004828 [Syzygium grande]